MSSQTAPSDRRHDLDALRSFAMLLGIALHAALAYIGAGWVVSDERTSAGLGVLVAAIHGFRMPLFFLLSGFFCAMLWRRRGPAPCSTASERGNAERNIRLAELIRQEIRMNSKPLYLAALLALARAPTSGAADR